MLSVRLDSNTESQLDEVCRRYGFTRSEAVKRSLDQWLKGFAPAPNAYELGEDLFDRGATASEPDDPMRRRIWEHLHAKYRSG
jgi:predicted transcriptional regulator